ncbi:putative methyl-accepting chemotaxis sensory transducer [Mycobacteroides abscessus subsp. abscessus]|nr:hypothetical protein MABM_51780 [Mycobacteroides abscessus]SIK16454.1 putative methyl-accepting chemotaxis sensory transducer [Mycobacteroides abscessus subsp. abscessus]SIL55304.1 putative methyl-accepting chemotaxis sensory transducer [Mycobacteroides abscessus subsp. abscessus]SIM44481.1 putative methyl-accepting chemotaxis sensory transducer [Mycobacteroides abscessus subsp. abscessus]SLF19879.1 putative methyl-accepting chemotaxis sensory transducer [Mycobacteroides abscessus subsp. abs
MVSESMPSREYSAFTVGPSWPLVSSEVVRAEAEANMQAAEEAGRAGEETRRLAEQFASDMKGRFVGAMYQGYINDAEIDFAKEKFLTEASQAGQRVADETLAAKSHLDHLDWQAHQQIEEMSKAGTFSEAAKWALIGQTAVAAAAYMTGATAQVASQTAKVTAAVHIPHKSGGAPNGRPGKPFHESPKIDRPGEVKPMGNEHGKDTGPGRDGSKVENSGEGQSDKAGDGTKTGGKDSNTDAMEKGPQRLEAKHLNSDAKQPSLGNAAGATPFSGGTPSGGSSGGSGSPASGLGSGLMGGSSNPAQAFQSGLKGAGSGGSPASGLSSGGSGFGKGVPGGGQGAGGSAAQVNPVRDFARGFTSSSAGSAAPLAQPASHAAPPASSVPPPAAPVASGTPAAAPGTAGSAGPLSGVAAAPPPAPAAPAPTGGSAVGGAAPNPSGLAPVGSDMGRHAAGAAPVVSGSGGPASAAGTSAPSIAGTAGTAAMGAGLLGAAPGTAGKRAGDAPRDPLLADAVQLVFRLMHASRYYPALDWCVAVFRSEGVTETVVTSNEGAGYIPVGVFLPRSARHLFSDPLVGGDFQDQWFGYTDPVATMMAYAELRRGDDGTLPVHALAASSLMGGALAVAEEAGVEHLHLCDKSESPYEGSNVDFVLDELHLHRLGVVDQQLLSWMHADDRTLAEITARADELSTKAFHATSARLGASQIMIPAVGAAVFNRLSNGEVVDDSLWDELFSEMRLAQATSGAARPVAEGGLGVEVYRCRHDIVRLLEMLYWWRPVGDGNAAGESICFTELAYSAEQIVGHGTD